MKCVLLAAGTSTRLRPLTTKTPKCLLPVGGIPLLERTLANLKAVGIRDICCVTGFRARAVRTFVRRTFSSFPVTFIDNPRFLTTNNAVSLSLTQPFVGNDPFLLLDSDIIFGKKLLKHLLTQKRRPNRIAVRVRGLHDEEEIRVSINRWDHIRRIGKTVAMNETYGESVGIEVFAPPASARLFEILQRRIRTAAGRKEFYEASFQSLIDEGHRIWAVDISDFPCTEIDTAEDLAFAEDVIVPRIDRG